MLALHRSPASMVVVYSDNGSKLSRCVHVSKILRHLLAPERVRRLRGGLNGWKRTNLPVDGDARTMFAGRLAAVLLKCSTVNWRMRAHKGIRTKEQRRSKVARKGEHLLTVLPSIVFSFLAFAVHCMIVCDPSSSQFLCWSPFNSTCTFKQLAADLLRLQAFCCS